MAAKPGAPRRRHSASLKAEVVAECERPGTSVAAIALSRGLNANLVHQWLRSAKVGPVARAGGVAPRDARFIELKMPPVSTPRRDIQIELRRGAMAVSVTWPVESAAECAA